MTQLLKKNNQKSIELKKLAMPVFFDTKIIFSIVFCVIIKLLLIKNKNEGFNTKRS